MVMHVEIIDVFTDVAFRGNPAGVVILDDPRPDAWMQDLAAELRHSETAFILRPGQPGAGPVSLRWFTPAAEVDLCGHGTLAAGFVLGGQREFTTRSGTLRSSTAPGGWVEVDFPADPPTPVPLSAQLLETLGGIVPVAAARGRDDILVQFEDAQAVREFTPHPSAIAALPARGLIVTAAGDGECAIVSRCFYPSLGIPEDPVTGSAHCALGSWWSPLLGSAEFVAEQASPRGGRIRLRVDGNRIHLAGQAVSVLSGRLSGGVQA